MSAKYNIHDFVTCFCEEFNKDMGAEIIEFKDNDKMAYIHFNHQNKRLDRWVPIHKLQPYITEAAPPKEERVMSRHERLLRDGPEEDDQITAENQKFEELHNKVTKIRNIEQITIGPYVIRSWYYSPYSGPFREMNHLFICEHCFLYFNSQDDLNRHLQETGEQHPPGHQIYRDGNIDIFEMQGKKHKLPCQCLCLLAKLFLDHKTLFYDVEGFVFYVLCETDESGCHIAAYFSKELMSDEGNVLACIVVLPPFQKKGYGRLLIDLSYAIARRENRSGGPERPLSDLGKIAFHSYWRDTIVELLKDHREIETIDEIERFTSISRPDIIEILKELNCAVKTYVGDYEFSMDKESLNTAITNFENSKKKPKINRENLIWLPGDDDRSFAGGAPQSVSEPSTSPALTTV